MAWDPINEAELIPGKNALKHMRQAWNCLLYLFGVAGSLESFGVKNGSMEVDSDADGTPDNWTWAAYPGGTRGIETASPAHGAQAFKAVHPGGAGNGGGKLSSDYINCSELTRVFLGFIHWATAAGMKNQVKVRFFDKGKVYIAASDATLYDSTANPTSPTYYIGSFLPPASARYYKIDLIGGYTDTDVAGTAYFDRVEEAGMELLHKMTYPHAIGEKSRVSGSNDSYTDVGSVSFACPVQGLPVIISFQADFKTSNLSGPVYIRFRIGSTHSNEGNTNSTNYVTATFTFAPMTITGTQVTLYMQLSTLGESGFTLYGRQQAVDFKLDINSI